MLLVRVGVASKQWQIGWQIKTLAVQCTKTSGKSEQCGKLYRKDNMYPITDVIGIELKEDDFVVFYSSIYKVKAVGTTKYSDGRGMVRLKIVDNPNAKTVVKHSKAIAKLDQQQVLLWMLKQGYKN
jgi:hypothetical protein